MRSRLMRLLSLLIGMAAAAAAPVTALAHGFAHHHEADEHHEIDHSASSVVRADHVDLEGLAVEPTDHGTGEHQHANLGAALTAKLATPVIALAAPRVLVPVAKLVVLPPPEADAPLAPRANPANAPPPRLRAPPSFLG